MLPRTAVAASSSSAITCFARAIETCHKIRVPLIAAVIGEGRLTAVRGIGEHIARRLVEQWTTGRMKFYEELADATPPGYLEMLRVPGLGAKKVRALGERLLALGMPSRDVVRVFRNFNAQAGAFREESERHGG